MRRKLSSQSRKLSFHASFQRLVLQPPNFLDTIALQRTSRADHSASSVVPPWMLDVASMTTLFVVAVLIMQAT